jgi:hypothetical protein
MEEGRRMDETSTEFRQRIQDEIDGIDDKRKLKNLGLDVQP